MVRLLDLGVESIAGLLGVTQKHVGVLLEKYGVLDARVALGFKAGRVLERVGTQGCTQNDDTEEELLACS